MSDSLNSNFIKTIILLFILSLYSTSVYSQQGRLTLSGKVVDNGNKPLRGARVTVISSTDTNNRNGAITDNDGNFIVEKLRRGGYKFEINFIGFHKYNKNIELSPETSNLGTIKMTAEDVKLGDVTVEGQMVRQEQKEDTTIFNAGAFKVNPDATTEDLIRKMPGVTVETDGSVKAQGENIQKVLVDGKEFFGDDPTLALRTIPAEIIDKIQVYDRASDQAQFTGFDDGNAQKTLNIITKSDKNQGNFGKLYAGYGTEDRFWAGGNINYFKGDSKVSVIGLSNNINQQNFAAQDILSATGSQASRRPGAMGGGRRPAAGGGGSPGGMFGGSRDFIVGQQNGISQTNSIGLNYSDIWSQAVNFTGSYFFNLSNNDNNSLVSRNFFTQNDISQFYNEENIAITKNYNHRINARLDYKIDSSNSLLITPRFNLQTNNYNSMVDGSTIINSNPVNQTENVYKSDLTGYNFDNSMLYRHKFPAAGRTFSMQLSTNINKNDGQTLLNSKNTIFDTTNNIIEINQDGDLIGDGYRINSEINYTEPVTDKSMLQFTYRPSYTVSNSDKEIYNITPGDVSNYQLDTLLSNNFENIYFQQRGGLSYSYRDDLSYLSLGIEYQTALLDGNQIFPVRGSTSFSFSDILPNARYQYNFSKTTNFRINYRTSANAPSVSQLQNVVDNSNPVLLKAGNPNLIQNYTHTLMSRIGSADPHSSSSIFAFGMISFTNDYIANSIITARKDTTIDNIPLFAGSQLSRPVNMDGYIMARSFLTYGIPVTFLKSNFNINGGLMYSRTPGLINDVKNTADNYSINSGVVLSSNISPELDFTISYNANYSIIKNSILPTQDNNYLISVANIKFNWIFWNGFLINTEVFHNLYKGLEQDFNQEFLLWNVSLGYKFLENNAGEIRLSVYDILGQNNSISRNVTEIYLEDLRTQVLQRYFMLTFTYNLRKFGS